MPWKSTRRARPLRRVNIQRRGMDALMVPRRGNHPEQLPLWEPNGVNPAGAGTPSGWRFRLVLAKDRRNKPGWTRDGFVRPPPPLKEAEKGGLFLRWILRGNGIARVIGFHCLGPNFRCERGPPPTPSSKLKTATPRVPSADGVGGFCACVCYRGTGPLENENIELVWGAFFFPGRGPLAGRDFPGRIVH